MEVVCRILCLKDLPWGRERLTWELSVNSTVVGQEIIVVCRITSTDDSVTIWSDSQFYGGKEGARLLW